MNPTGKTDLAPATKNPFSQAAIWICEKCGKKLDPENNPAIALRDQLKKDLLASGAKGKVRAMVSSCLDLCPKERVALALVASDGSQPTQFFEIDRAAFENPGITALSAQLRDLSPLALSTSAQKDPT